MPSSRYPMLCKIVSINVLDHKGFWIRKAWSRMCLTEMCFIHVLNTMEVSDKVCWNKNFQSKSDQGLSFFSWRFPNSEDMLKKCPVGICFLCVLDMSELPDKLWRDKIFKSFVQGFAPLYLGKSRAWPKTIFDQFQHLPIQN